MKKFEAKKANFGHQKMMVEREKLRRTYSKRTNECKSNPSDRFCVHLGIGEFKFLDEIRAIQTLKSLNILQTKNTNI